MKKLLISLLIIAVVSAGYLTFQRYQIVNNNQTVELVMDYSHLEAEEQTLLLPKLKQQGLTTLALQQKSLQQLAEEGKINYITGQLLDLLTRFDISISPTNLKALYITGQPEVLEQLEQKVNGELLKPGLLQVKEDNRKLLMKPLVFSPEAKRQGQKLGLNILPRIAGGDKPQQMRQSLVYLSGAKQIIFSGRQVVGYPGQLAKTAQIFADQQLTLGLIEPFLARQQGEEELARLLNFQAVRVHSIQQQELAELGVDQTVNRYLRAVKERGVRLLYLKPFTESKLTEQLVTKLTAKLTAANYKLEAAQPYNNYHLSKRLIGLILLGTAALIGLASELLKSGFGPTSLLLSSLGLGSLAVINWQLTLQLAALLIAIIIPWLVCLLIVKFKSWDRGSLSLFLLVTGLSVGGGLLIRGLLSAPEYLLQLARFRGVKLAFVLPLVLSSGYVLINRYQDQANLFDLGRQLMNRPATVKEILLGGLLLISGVVYITRTGNLPLLEVSDLEVAVRRGLEQILPIRPRFKSFLIGHPLLLMGITSTLHSHKVSWLVVGGLIGQINLINTFAHLHTPISVVLLRVGEGVILGTALGLLTLKMINVK